MKPFLTGSHCYGTPNEKSDADLVVLLDPELISLLEPLSDEPGSVTEDGSICLRFGKLDLICCGTQHTYDTWKEGTDTLVKEKPVTRDVAKALFASLRRMKKVRKEY